MKRFACVGTVVASLLIGGTAQAVNVVWDGGNGNWEDANWNGGQTSAALLGTSRGLNVGNGELGTDVFVTNGDINFDAEILGDFRWEDHTVGGSDLGTLTISGGASVNIDTAPPGDADGVWSQFNTKALNLNNGTLRRSFTPTDPGFPGNTILTGGIFSFNGTSGEDNADIQINITNGGSIVNDGILSYGWYQNSYANTTVAMTINNGSLDLTGGDNFDFLLNAAGGAGNPDLLFHQGYDNLNSAPSGEDYSINFKGPGSIKVDHSGILIVKKIGPGGFDYDFGSITTLVTYEDVWNAGILRAHGFSGLDGKIFSDYFTVTGTSGVDGYILTSNVIPGDFDLDNDVDPDDLSGPTSGWETQFGNGLSGIDFLDWQKNFGTVVPLSGLSAGAVPEPTSAVLLIMGLSTLLYRRRAAA